MESLWGYVRNANNQSPSFRIQDTLSLRCSQCEHISILFWPYCVVVLRLFMMRTFNSLGSTTLGMMPPHLPFRVLSVYLSHLFALRTSSKNPSVHPNECEWSRSTYTFVMVFALRTSNSHSEERLSRQLAYRKGRCSQCEHNQRFNSSSIGSCSSVAQVPM